MAAENFSCRLATIIPTLYGCKSRQDTKKMQREVVIE
jgi:hypothetical protein